MKMLSTKLIAFVFLMFCFQNAILAADGTPLWTNIFNGTGNNDDQAKSLAVDGNGNVYITGYSTGSGSYFDYATIKYSSGGVPQWTNRYASPGFSSDIAYSSALDGAGNLYVTGASQGGVTYDIASIKYSSAGIAVWTNRFNGPANNDDQPKSVVVDGTGNIFVCGYSVGSASYQDYVTLKYSNAGVPLWTNYFNGVGNYNDSASSLAVDASGNVFVTGYSYNASGTSEEFVTIKYSTTGVAVWTNKFIGYDSPFMAIDNVSNIFVAGSTPGSGFNRDWIIVKYSNSGTALWTNRYNRLVSADGDDIAKSLAIDQSGNAFVTGYSVDNSGYADYTTIKYSVAGFPIWTNLFNGPFGLNDYAQFVSLDGDGNVYVNGQSYNNNFTMRSHFATIKYSNFGLPIWTNIFTSATNFDDIPQSFAVDKTGNVYVTGYISGGGSGYDYVTIKYSAPTPLKFLTTGTNFGFTNKQFRLTLVGPAGSNAVISASTNLQTWILLQTNPLSGGLLNFTDTVATNYSRRFYRANLQ
jgi:hypothetical protein